MDASTSHPIVLGFMRKSMRQNSPGRFCLIVSQGSDPLAQESERGGVTGAHFLARNRVCAKSCGLVTEVATTGAHCLAEAPRIAVWWPEARPQMHIPWQNREQVPRNAALWSRGVASCSTSRNPTPSLSPKAPTAATAGRLPRQGVARRVAQPDCIAGHGVRPERLGLGALAYPMSRISTGSNSP